MKKQLRSYYPRRVQLSAQKQVNYCGIRCCIEVLGGKWKLLIVAELLRFPKRYSELNTAIPEISEKMLTESLKALAHHNIVEVVKKDDLKIYQLTTYGRSVVPLLHTLFEWGENHIKLNYDKIFH